MIHNLITSRAVPEIVLEHGGTPVRTRVGHSFIKAEMARTDAVFGGEHSAHYYFRDFWRADTGMLAALHVLAALGEQGEPLSRLASAYERYVASGEINSEVADQAAATEAVRSAFDDPRPASTVDELDGLTVGTARTGGSTCGPPTPSRCCGSTSRRPTGRRWSCCATRCWPLSATLARPTRRRPEPCSSTPA